MTPASAPAMVDRLIDEGLDMIVGTRVHEAADAYRRGHVLGNRAMTGLLASLFGRSFTDIFSGYRVFSRRFVKSFPALSAGFEIETEISVHALELKMPVGEVETRYLARLEGSASKLNTYRDGLRIGRTIATLYRIERPMWFFGAIAALLALVAIVLSVPLLVTYPRHAHRAAFPDRDPGDRADDRRGAQPVHRADPRYRGARSARDEAAGLSRGARPARLTPLRPVRPSADVGDRA